MKYSGHRKLLCELLKLSKCNAFNLHGYLNEHWCICSYLQIPPRENWFQYVRRVYATAINFPCNTTLIVILCYHPRKNKVINQKQSRGWYAMRTSEMVLLLFFPKNSKLYFLVSIYIFFGWVSFSLKKRFAIKIFTKILILSVNLFIF